MIFDLLERAGPRASVGWSPLDTRWYQHFETFRDTFAGFPIDAERAKRVSAVFACNSLIAETLGSLPCHLMRRTADGKTRARDHRAYRMARVQPGRRETPMEFYPNQQMHVGLRGQAVAQIVDDGRRLYLDPLDLTRTTVARLPSGRLRFEEQQPDQAPRVFLEDEVLHVRDISADGITGQARTVLAQEAIGVAAAGEAFVGGFFRNDASGRVVLVHKAGPPKDAEAKKKYLAELGQEWGGWRNRSKAKALWGDVDVKELGQHGDSAFIVDPRKFQVADIARFWRVPLFMIGLEEKSTSWGSGLETQMIAFATFTIKPWTDRWSQAMTRDLLTEDEQEQYFFQFDLHDLMRGDQKSRYEAYAIADEHGWLSDNEIRGKEDMNTRGPDGDRYQNTPTGAAPNPPPPRNESPDAEARGVPSPLVADAARRLAAADARDRARAPNDPAAKAAWYAQEQERRRTHITTVLAPLAEASGVPDWLVASAVSHVEHLGQTGGEVAAFLADTFRAGALRAQAA